MRRIKFYELRNSWLILTLLLVSILIILIQLFGKSELILFQSSKINKIIAIFPYIMLTYVLLTDIRFNHYVRWNKIRIFIHLDGPSWGWKTSGIMIPFKEIKDFAFENNLLTVNRDNGVSHYFDLTEFDENDSRRLVEIFNTYAS